MAKAEAANRAASVGNGVAVAERTDVPNSLWLSALPAVRRTPVADLLPQVLGLGDLEPLTEPLPVPATSVMGEVAAKHGPISDIAISPDGRYLVVAHYAADTLRIIDTATMKVTATVDGVREPAAVAIADRAYVSSACIEGDSIVAVDTRTGIPFASQEVDMTTGGLAVSPAGDMLFVARSGDDVAQVAFIDIESGTTSVVDVATAPGASIAAVRISTDGGTLFAALATVSGGSVAVIDVDAQAVAAIVPLRGTVADIAVHPDGRKVFATGWDGELGGVIHVVDTATGRILDTLGVGGLPTQLIVAGRGDVVYFIDRDEIVVLNTMTHEVVDSIVVGGQLSCLAASGNGARVYVADYAGGVTALRVGAIAGSTLGELLPAGLRQLEAAAR
jgi:YVTN family beta-propeller protein